MPTLRDLQKLHPAATVEHDRAAGCYTIFAAEARADLAERLSDPALSLEVCDEPGCEWCEEDQC